jgi:glucose-6-phosphate 1-dehydrogenase
MLRRMSRTAGTSSMAKGKATVRRAASVDPMPVHAPRAADPCAMVIFGAFGDMTKRLLVPALYNLARTKMLPEKFALIGADLADASTASWREHLHEMLKSFVGGSAAGFHIERIDQAAWKRLSSSMTYIQGDATKPELYERLRIVLAHA